MSFTIPVRLPDGTTTNITLPVTVPPADIPALQATINGQITAALPVLESDFLSGNTTKFASDLSNLERAIIADFAPYVNAPCFASGTMIRTDRGDVRVEDLAVGDIAITSQGTEVPIKWLGHRSVDCRRHPRPHEVMPVRVAANAFAEGRPARDLLVSPGHALCINIVGEVLIPAMALVNGVTIDQEDADHVTYWHVELEGGHNIILSENMPSESYIEMGNRSFFAEGGLVSLDASPNAVVVTHADFCRPYHASGPLVNVIKAQLLARADLIGWHHEHVDITTCRLVVDGVSIVPKQRERSLLFKVPGGASDVWLVSSVGIPAELSDKSRDYRSLGLQVAGIAIGDGYSSISVMPDDSRLVIGFHKVEQTGEASLRWTDGRACLPLSLWEGLEGDLFFRINVGGELLPRWVCSERKPELALVA